MRCRARLRVRRWRVRRTYLDGGPTLMVVIPIAFAGLVLMPRSSSNTHPLGSTPTSSQETVDALPMAGPPQRRMGRPPRFRAHAPGHRYVRRAAELHVRGRRGHADPSRPGSTRPTPGGCCPPTDPARRLLRPPGRLRTGVVGSRVEAGRFIGCMDDTGSSASLHFENHPNGVGAVNPYPVLRGSGGCTTDEQYRQPGGCARPTRPTSAECQPSGWP